MFVGIGVGIGRNRFAQGIFNAYNLRVVADGGITEAGNCVNAVSSLLQSASLLLIPSGYKANKLYSEIPTNGNGDLTWTRTSTAIRTNSSGLLESMGTGVPRLSYMYGSCPSVLLEPQRTNLALQSEDFSSASWIKSLSSVTANTATSPDGNTTADSFIGDGTSAAHNMSQSINVTSGVTYSISVYSKKNTNNFVQILGSAGAFGVSFYANFDLNNGAVGTVGSSATASITSVGNGWYRCTITGAATATVASFPGVTLITSSTSVRNEINTLSTSVYLWGFQMELGAYPTTIIPTTTASATRIADSFSRNNIYTNGLITSSGGTWFFELKNNVLYARDNTQGMFIGDGTSSNAGNQIIIRATSGGRLALFKCIAGVPTQIYGTASDNLKLSIKWDGTSADVFANGTKVVTATSFTTTNMENLIGLVGTPVFIQQMALFPTPLSDTDCTTLTT